ncbi:MAG: phosphodiester glycosidase family protein [Gemmatimonadales bacterium]
MVVDGRQLPYSDGMTLRELAELLRGLGAREAINLDGGGSSTLVYADPDSAGQLRVANRPSDATGERPVGNALAVVQGCRR